MTLIEEDLDGNVLSKTEVNVSDDEMDEFSKLFCECENPDSEPKFRRNYMGVNHGWVCRKCGKFVQIG